jgi:lysozyme
VPHGRPNVFVRLLQHLPSWAWWIGGISVVAVYVYFFYYIFVGPFGFRWRALYGDVSYPEGYEIHGIDISHHQGKIDWDRVASSSQANGYPIKFVIMKATESDTFTDPDYRDNIADARKAGFVCGVYHFYDPGTSPDKQAKHFINTVNLMKGDLVPVVDVERAGRASDLRKDLLVYLKTLERHYGVKPIIYASAKFRRRHLNTAEFDAYPFWVAHYYVVRPVTDKQWRIWQFTDHASVDGIREYTDFNVFRGTDADFNSLRIK